jgi:hypothetical protein
MQLRCVILQFGLRPEVIRFQVTLLTRIKRATHRLETANVPTSKTFVINNNEITKDVEVPIYLDPTAEYIKDYEALKDIWEALDGPNWTLLWQ